ncbi:MAG: TerC family protein [Candidatus Melainabacteria bacterium]|jgi:predicted tellurium resistance membrane protein TerC|nr:TerC family protein [Candidatus Melainabacteria bacterium]MBX9673251.1 TerC family protein [Candidatus Obscuribacterales bacterium]
MENLLAFVPSLDVLGALFTLTVLEIVLGVDNVIFISILAEKLPASMQARARMVGLAAAMLTRIALLFSLSLIMSLTAPLVAVAGHEFSGRDLILLSGGLFLLYKSVKEMHHKVEGAGEEGKGAEGAVKAASFSFVSTIAQIMVLDIVFSLDSVITAVGMSNNLYVMIGAIVIAVGFMMFSAGAISSFISRHPAVKLLALAFLLLIGATLVAEGFGQHVAKGYIYFAMAFSVCIELLNIRMRRNGLRK